MTDFELYDVPTTCRVCSVEYLAKSFLPADGTPRFGLCPTHLAEDETHMAKLKAPHPRARVSDPKVIDFRSRAAGRD